MKSLHPGLNAIALAVLALTPPDAARAAELVLTFHPTFGDAPIERDAPGPETVRGERWSVTRLSALFSGLRLRQIDGDWQKVATDPAWISLTDQRLTWRIPNAPEGEWSALSFDVGLPPELNDQDPAAWPPDHPLNPNLNLLHWSWQGGYIFLALEGHYQSAARASEPFRQARNGFAYHLAREAFRTPVTLPADILLQPGQPRQVEVEWKVDRILSGPRPISFSTDGSSTHSQPDDPVAASLKANLAESFQPRQTTPVAPLAVPTPGKVTATDPNTKTLSFPSSFPPPRLPPDNPLTPERVTLGRRLFHETALSRTQRIACASCHLADHALSDPQIVSTGVDGRVGHRNAMPLFNLAWKTQFFWDGRAATLREQVLEPIEDHREMDESLERVVARLATSPGYPEAFSAAFGHPGITAERLALALEAFLLTLVSHDSKFDRVQRGQESFTPLEQRGFTLFITEREPRLGQLGGDCFHCHGGSLFTDHQFRNNGLAIDPKDLGRSIATGSSLDRGAFSTPSLRNVSLTAPYMHDGRFPTLEAVLKHYSHGVQRTETLDPNLAKHPDGGLHLSEDDQQAIIAFLRTLTDDRFARSKETPPSASAAATGSPR